MVIWASKLGRGVREEKAVALRQAKARQFFFPKPDALVAAPFFLRDRIAVGAFELEEVCAVGRVADDGGYRLALGKDAS